MAHTIGILLFDGVEELDFAGPWEVFGVGAMLGSGDWICSVAQQRDAIQCAKGLSVNPQHTFETHPNLDVVLVPGGRGTERELNNPILLDWLRQVSPRCKWVTSVCTGALLLHGAGLAHHKRVTTHWRYVDALRERGEVTVLEDCRYVRDGNLVTAAGVSAGIDMSLWLLGQLHSAELARQVQRRMQYDPAPPYAAEV